MVCWLLGRLGCLVAWVICWVFGWLGHAVWCLYPMVCGAVCCCMLCDVMCVGTHVITASPREGGGLVSRYFFCSITSDRRVPDYGLHGVLRVLLCAINGTRDLVVQLTGKALANVARTMLQPVLDEARLAA